MNVNIRCLQFNVFNSDFLNLTYQNRSCSGTPKSKWPYLCTSTAVLAQVSWELPLFGRGLSLGQVLKHSVTVVLTRLLGSVDVRSGG